MTCRPVSKGLGFSVCFLQGFSWIDRSTIREGMLVEIHHRTRGLWTCTWYVMEKNTQPTSTMYICTEGIDIYVHYLYSSVMLAARLVFSFEMFFITFKVFNAHWLQGCLWTSNSRCLCHPQMNWRKPTVFKCIFCILIIRDVCGIDLYVFGLIL